MQSMFPHVEVTKSDRALVGKKDVGTRMYRQSGPMEEAGKWFDRLRKRYPGEGFVSPGGVCMYAQVSRAAVYLRINSGKLTAFCYHPSKFSKTLFGGVRKSRETPYVYIPVSECKAWGEEVKLRAGPSDDPGWLPEKEFVREHEKIGTWPKHVGKTSPPKWKQKKQAAQKRGGGSLLRFF